jgi:DNA-binding response OmpR family regulator
MSKRPEAESTREDLLSQVQRPSAQGRARRVLLVEDNEDSASALAELLRLADYEVQVAHSVQHALTLCDDVDLVISDIGLPDGTGHDLMRQICARRRIPGIALSGYGTSDDERKSVEAGFDRHLVKPIEPHELLRILQTLPLPTREE